MSETVEQIGRWFASNPWAIIMMAVSTVGGFGLGIWGIVLFYAGSRHRLPSYCIRTNNLIRGLANLIPEVEIKYHGHGEPIPNLSVSSLAFFNRGKEPIRKSDIAKKDPIVIKMPGDSAILHVDVVFRSNEVNQFVAKRSQDRKTCSIEFEFLGHTEGAVIQIIHTSVTDDGIVVGGTVIGHGSVKQVLYGRMLASRRRFFIRLACVGAFVLFYIAWFFSVKLEVSEIKHSHKSYEIKRLILCEQSNIARRSGDLGKSDEIESLISKADREFGEQLMEWYTNPDYSFVNYLMPAVAFLVLSVVAFTSPDFHMFNKLPRVYRPYL